MLKQRQLDVLNLVVKIYTATGTPVGSKTLMSAGIKASSATIRNDLALLEELGFLQKTHVSSGRIPSNKGYRYYVDNLLEPSEVSTQESEMIRSLLGKQFYVINDIVEESAKILSQLTQYTAFSLGPDLEEKILTGFRIVPLNEHQLMAVIVTNRGNVQSQIFTVPDNINSEDIERIVEIFNDRLVGQSMVTVYQKMRTEIPLILQRYFQSPTSILELFEAILQKSFEDDVFVSGRINLLDFASVTDRQQFRSLFSLMSDHEQLASLFTNTNHAYDILIGSEMHNELLSNMSLILMRYKVTGHGTGTLALLGPNNMSYDKAIGLMDVFKDELTNQLTEYYRSLE